MASDVGTRPIGFYALVEEQEDQPAPLKEPVVLEGQPEDSADAEKVS